LASRCRLRGVGPGSGAVAPCAVRARCGRDERRGPQCVTFRSEPREREERGTPAEHPLAVVAEAVGAIRTEPGAPMLPGGAAVDAPARRYHSDVRRQLPPTASSRIAARTLSMPSCFAPMRQHHRMSIAEVDT